MSSQKNRQRIKKQTQERLTNEIDNLQNKLNNLPDPDEFRQEANRIRTQLKLKYSSPEHWQNMSFEDKKSCSISCLMAKTITTLPMAYM